jgi:hypothetical protein
VHNSRSSPPKTILVIWCANMLGQMTDCERQGSERHVRQAGSP